MLQSQIEVAATEAVYAATVMCWIFGALAVVALALCAALAVLAVRDSFDGTPFGVCAAAACAMAFCFIVAFLINLHTVLAPHYAVVPNLIGGG